MVPLCDRDCQVGLKENVRMAISSTKSGDEEGLRFGLRLAAELHARLEKAAGLNHRSLNKEIVDRLERSLEPVYSSKPKVTALLAGQEAAPVQLSEIETAMLSVFNHLQVEKQLALLSLFK